MSLESLRCRWPRGTLETLALIAWTAATLAIIGRVSVAAPKSHSVYPVFKSAGRFWSTGHGLYGLPEGEPDAPIYRYSPVVGTPCWSHSAWSPIRSARFSGGW